MNYAKILNEVKEANSFQLKDFYNAFSQVKYFAQKTDGVGHDFLIKVENIFDIVEREWEKR